MKFRKASISDLPVIVEIYNSTIASRMVTADTEKVSVESRLAWFHGHSGHRPLWIVEENEEILGWASFHSFYGRPAYDATAEISIYLSPGQRGLGHGIKILAECMSRCGELKINTLLGFIFAHNEPSLKLFRKAGFNQWGLLPDIAVLDKVERSLMIVGKRVNK